MAHLEIIQGEAKPRVDQDTVKMLRQLLEEAERGEITAAAAVVVADGTAYHMMSGTCEEDPAEILWGIEALKHQLLTESLYEE